MILKRSVGALPGQMACNMSPKGQGRLRDTYLERFTRALRVKWMWFSWKNSERAWMGLDILCDKTNKDYGKFLALIMVA